MEIKSVHKEHRKRMRKKIIEYGMDTFSEHEVLECLLHYSIPVKDTNELAHELIERFGSLKSVMRASYSDLVRTKGISEVSAALIILFRELNMYINTKQYDKMPMTSSRVVGRFCCNYFKHHINENFIVISLDSAQNIKYIDVISKGSEFQTGFYKDKIIESAIKSKAASIILAHNHPGGFPEPSTNDISLTAAIVKSLRAVDIKVIDHVVCNDMEYVSMSDRGVMK